MDKILFGFEIQTNNLISTRRSDPVLINKERTACYLVDIAVPVGK